MKYVLIAKDWDYECPELPKWLKIYQKRKIYTPLEIEYIADMCGEFETKANLEIVIEQISIFKKEKWPIIKFELWQNEELVREF